MESTCYKRFLSASSDDTECYFYPKRMKIESNQKSIEKEEQQELEQSIQSLSRYQTSPQEPMCLSERENSWALEMQSCDTARETAMREFFHFQTYSNERLPCRASENKLPFEKWSPENEDQSTREDGISLKGHGQPPETESPGVWSAASTCKNLQVINPAQTQQKSRIEQNNKRNGDNELRQNSSAPSLNGDLFQKELLNHKSVSDKKWKQYQLLQISFLCGSNSVFSHTEHQKDNLLKKVCSSEDKDYSCRDNETSAENKGKCNPSYVIPALKPFKSIQPLQIPNFQFSSISNKTNSKIPSTHLKETGWENFKGQPSLRQSQEIHSVQNMPEIGKQKLQNDKSSVTASALGSECREMSCPSISRQEHSTSAEKGRVPVTYSRDNSTNVVCNQICAENNFKGKRLQNSDGDDDEKSRIHIYISAKNVQNEKCISHDDLLKRTGRRSSEETMASFPLQASFPVKTEALEKNQLAIRCGVRNSSSVSASCEAESKNSTGVILDFQRYFTENVIFENNWPHVIVRNFPDKKVRCNVIRGKEMFKLKLSLQNMLFGWVRTGTESLAKDMPTVQGDGIAHQFHFCKTLCRQCDAQVLVKSNVSWSQSSKIHIFVLTIISKHLKAEPLKTVLSSFSDSRNTLLPTEAKSVRVENHPSSGRKQVRLNSCTDNTLRQNTVFHKEPETYAGIVSSKFVEIIGFVLHNECQGRHSSRSLGEEETAFLKRGALFCSQKSGSCKGRHVRKHHLLPRGSDRFSTYLRSVSHKNGMKKQILVAKCLILLQGTFGCSSVEKMYCCIITKMQYLIGASLRFGSYFPGRSQLKFEKVNSECTKQETSVTQVILEKKKPREIVNSSFLRETCNAFPFVLCENKTHKTSGCRSCTKSTNGVPGEVTYAVRKYLGTCSYMDADRKECVKSKELQIIPDNFLSTNYFSIFDTYEKIPLTTNSEEFDQIPVVNQDYSVNNMLSEEDAVTSSKEVHDLPAESNDAIIVPEQSKTAMEKCKTLLLQDNQTNQLEYCEKIDTYSPHVANEEGKLEDRNISLNFADVISGSSDVSQSVPLPLGSSSPVSEEGTVSEDGHCRSPSSADKQKQSEKIPATGQYPSLGSPAGTDACSQLQAKEAVCFALQGHTQTNEAAGSEPATWKQHFEYVKEQEEISDEQRHVTDESQCETVMNDLIMSYSGDESKTFIAAEEELKMHLSVMNNGCLEDVEEEYLPLENKITYEFELKRKFDLVLEELHMFHEISMGNENNLSSLETNSHHNYCELNNSEGTDGNVTSVSQKKTDISSPICGNIEGQNITDSNESSLNKNIPNENEDQKVCKERCISVLSSEELLHSPVAEGNRDAAYKEPHTWDPAFLFCSLLKEQNYHLQKERGYFLSHDVIRVQPLKTCKGPIRIGLSRKARPKQLHPYLK